MQAGRSNVRVRGVADDAAGPAALARYEELAKDQRFRPVLDRLDGIIEGIGRIR